MANPRVGFIGLGLMGHGMAKNLVTKGFPLTVRAHRNRKPLEDLVAAGAKEAKTVEEIVFGDDGIASVARAGMIVVDTSTSEPATTTKTREALAAKGVAFVDAPLSRTPVDAEAGRLNTMVGADAATFEQLKPVLSAYCENIVHAGPPGHGLVLKLINNFVAQAMCAAFAEAMAAATKSGLSIDKLHQLMSAGPINSPMFQMIVGKAKEGDLTALKFTLVNAAKDLRYYTHFTESMMLPSIMGEATHQTLVIANALGFGDKFVPSLIEAQEKLTGLSIVPRK